jgi:hypothetical protein
VPIREVSVLERDPYLKGTQIKKLSVSVLDGEVSI